MFRSHVKRLVLGFVFPLLVFKLKSSIRGCTQEQKTKQNKKVGWKIFLIIALHTIFTQQLPPSYFPSHEGLGQIMGLVFW